MTIPDWLPWALMVGGGAVVIAVLVWAVCVKRSERVDVGLRDQDEAPTGRTAPSPTSPAAPTSPDPSVELMQIVQTMTGELDRKIDRLERLLAAADQRISALQRTGDAPRSAAAGSSDASITSSGAGRHTASDDHLSAEVVRLAEQGLTPLQIAQRLGQGVGMVELVLALRR